MKCLHFLVCIYFLLTFTRGDRVEEISVTLELLELDLEDKFEELELVQKQILLKQTNARKQKIELEKNYGLFARSQSKELKESHTIEDLDLVELITRQWVLFTKMGDALLPEENWNKLVTFKNYNEQLIETYKFVCNNSTKNCTKTDVRNILQTSHNPKELQKTWSSYQDIFNKYSKQYPQILKLVNKAAKENGEKTAQSYWEMLVEYPDAYETAQKLWDEIKPLYIKFQEFVKLRLEQYYSSQLSNSTTIPVYLLGSEFGTDWSHIAPLILPHRYLYDEITDMLNFEKVGGRKVYEVAETLTSDMGLGKAEDLFWKESIFNYKCPSHLLTYSKHSSVVTCNATGWVEYLDAHEDMMRTTLNQMENSAKAFSAFRISALDEALASLSGILAIKNLPLAGIVPEDVFFENEDENHNKMTALLLIALRTLPRLPYYLLADLWRLEQIKEQNNNGNFTSESWWKYREEMQLVSGVTNMEYDFLGDSYINSNQPYIGKFMGTILQFEILEYFQNEDTDGVNILTHIANEENFRKLLEERPLYDWPKVLSDNLYYDIAADSLLEYFKPLEDYMDKAPAKQVTQTVRPKTTTPLPTTTTEKPTTVATSDIKLAKIDSYAIQNTDPEIREHVQDDALKKPVLSPPPKTAVGTQEVFHNDEEPTQGSAMGMWIGIVVGVAALLVVVVIVVRKQCTKKPFVRNRRNEV